MSMPVLQTISLAHLFKAFKDHCGYTQDEVVTIITNLLPYWVYNDFIYDITAEFIRSEMDLDTLTAETFLLEVGRPLAEIGEMIRQMHLNSSLIRWSVRDYVIVLEMNDGY